ncbi:hypothetical protein, partial [Streptomyces alfalfae]
GAWVGGGGWWAWSAGGGGRGVAGGGRQRGCGARPLRRTIQREVDNRLSRLLLDGRLTPGSRVTVDVADDALTMDTTAGAPAV